MTYNVLAKSLITEDSIKHFKEFELKYLNWNYRADLILKEIEFVSPDILCLQEVDNNENILQKGLEKRGFSFIYHKRTRDRIDGEAICFLKSRYDLLENKYIEFFIHKDNVLFNRDNIALFAVLKDKSNYLCAVIVATTHLLFNKKRGNIKLSQITIICEILNDLQNKYLNLGYNTIVLFSGDFNMIPCSGLYNYMAHGLINVKECASAIMSGQMKSELDKLKYYKFNLNNFLLSNICKYRIHERDAEKDDDYLYDWIVNLRNIKYSTTDYSNKISIYIGENGINGYYNQNIEFQNSIILKSAYSNFYKFYYSQKKMNSISEISHPPYSNYEPFYSTWGKDFIGTVDYIWFNFKENSYNHQHKNSVRIRSVYEMPKIEILKNFNYFPNKFFPSDHFSLAVEFEYCF